MINMERYTYEYDYDENYELGFVFKDNGKQISYDKVCEILNKQDKLKKELKSWVFL